MTKIPIITQNFSSPDGFNDTPLMLLPQTSTLPLSDKDQEGFSQLLLHDLHRHRQSYVRSYTAFETLKKRQDFILRQENLRALQNVDQRISTKQDQYIDQSFHSYEQCFVKVINGNSITNRNIQEQQKRPHTAAPSFDKFHIHQLSHISPTTHDQSPIIPFQRYQKTHRPQITSKYRNNTSIHHVAQSFHDAFQSSTFTNQSQPFLSFTESYLQKYGDRSSNKLQIKTYNDGMEEIQERKHEDEDEQIQSILAESNPKINRNKKQTTKSKTPDLQHVRPNVSSRNTNTPSSTPQIGFNDALRDGLTLAKDDNDLSSKLSIINEKRRSSQQSTSQISNSDNRINIKRPKTAKKKQVTTDLTSAKKTELVTTKTTDNDLLKTAMIVQNYGSNTIDLNHSSDIERLQLPTNTNNLPIKGISSAIHRSSINSNEGSSETKQYLNDIDTQMAAKTPPPPPTPKTPPPTIERTEPLKEQTIINNNKDKIIDPLTTIENKQPITEKKPELEVVDNRKRIKKGAFDTESMSDMIAFELGVMGNSRSAMKKSKSRLGKENQHDDETKTIPENQETLDLLEKFRQSATGLSIGQLPISQQGCRFELPYDLKLLETLTPLDYLGKYCRLSSRRNYQFKRVFDKYRNNQYRFESNNLYTSITDIHKEKFTSSQYDKLCQLINIGNEQHQFTFDTFAGILALCERILYDSKAPPTGVDEQDLVKDTLEKCDFDCLDRKLDGLIISETMRKLLKIL
ncbi:unnamed protein product [Rotaria sp. Silwood2]|nr:unnamed protein product [Rotaria sp. Silwood2]CAF2851568.1 unnamed protein product [Rotaria sp. Silwood2]CAF2997912.1 unnamed protein product [Rotaria sp. Silwood2]CAF3875858.1 unnamed protein product [Rotaria sp. Silwood2]CAF4053906.1 unnamed protein product [Rotaria sp. Silwood2]